MNKIGDAQFRVMCDMWGVDSAIKAAKEMGGGSDAGADRGGEAEGNGVAGTVG